MSENPFEAPAVANAPENIQTPPARGVPASLFSRIISAAMDFVIWFGAFAGAIWVIGAHGENLLKTRVGMSMVILFAFCAQALPAYFRGATIGMAVMALQYDSHVKPGVRGLLNMTARNLGFLSPWFMLLLFGFLPDMENETLQLILGLVLVVALILLPLFQIIGGLFVFGPTRRTLQDRITGSRVVYIGRP